MNDDGRFGNAGFERLGELLRNYRPAEIVALRLIALMSLEEFQLLLLASSSIAHIRSCIYCI